MLLIVGMAAAQLGGAVRLTARRALAGPRVARMSETAVAVPKQPAAAPVAVTAPPAAKTVVVKKGPGFFGRVGTFLTGLALGSGVAFYALHKDVWDSTVQLEQSIYNLKTDVVAENRKMRQSVAKLEQELAAIKAGRA